MIMAAKALLDHTPNPSREEVVEAISGNICRCTGYEPIIQAVLTAARANSHERGLRDVRWNCAKDYFADQRKDDLQRDRPAAAARPMRPAMSPAGPPTSPTATFPACSI